MATTQDLLKVLQGLQDKTEVVDKSEYRYVIYARKSTESEERQAKSLGDQVIECTKMAEARGLKIVGKPIQEKRSAKEPDI